MRDPVLSSPSDPGADIFAAFVSANWASYFLGITIVFIDLSLILLYRAGWDVSIGTLIANIGVSRLSPLSSASPASAKP